MKALKDFKSYSDTKISSFASVVDEKMGKTNVFDDYKATYELLNPALVAYNAAYPLSVRGGEDAITEKDRLKKILIGILEELCDGVNMVAKGRIEIIQLSGFNHSKEGSTAGVPLIPVSEFKIKFTANAGVFEISYKAQRSVKTANVFFSHENPALVEDPKAGVRVMTKSKQNVNIGLTSGYIYIWIVLNGILGDEVTSPVIYTPITKLN